MPLYDALLDIQKKQADIGHVDALTQLDQMRAQQAQQAMRSDAAARMALRDAELARENEQRVEAGGLPRESENPVDNNPRLKDINAVFKKAADDYAHFQNLARKARLDGGVDPKLAEKFDDDAAKALDQMQNAQLRLLAERKAVLGELGSTLGSANAGNWPQVKMQLDRTMPGWDRGQDVDFSPLEGGAVVWGPRTARVVGTLKEQALTRHQQVDRDEKTAQLMRQEAHDDDLAAEYESRDRAREQRNARDRERIEATKKRDQAREARADAKASGGKTGAIKTPTVAEVNDETESFIDEYQLPRRQAKLAARDYLNNVNDQMRRDPKLTRADAEALARTEIAGRIEPGTEGKPKYLGFIPFTGEDATPGAYRRRGGSESRETKGAITPAPEDAAAVATIEPLAKAGLDVSVVNGVVSAKGGGPVKVTTKAQAELLPKGTRFVDPSGKEWVRK